MRTLVLVAAFFVCESRTSSRSRLLFLGGIDVAVALLAYRFAQEKLDLRVDASQFVLGPALELCMKLSWEAD